MRYTARLLLALVASVMLVGAGNAIAAAAPVDRDVTTFTLDAVPTLGSSAQATARGWDKGTVVGLETGSCVGFRCITVVVDDASCGSAGCATRYSDGSCLVQVTTPAVNYGEKVQNTVVAHEVGHCMGLGHNENYRSIMYFSVDPYDPNWIISEDRRDLNAIWSVGTTRLKVSQHATNFGGTR